MRIKLIIPLLVLILFSFTTIKAQNINEIDSKEVKTMLEKDKKYIVLDVRTAEEFKSGHIISAINIDIRQSEALNKIDKLEPNSRYIVYCRTNHRSKTVVDYMVQKGFKTVYQMTDGITGWNQNGLPVKI